MKKNLLRLLVGLIGLSGFGVIFAEILKKWKLISSDLSLLWIIAPILILFLCREIARSSHIKENKILSQNFTKVVITIIDVIFIVASIFICASIPFLWFGVIEELGTRGGY